MASRSRWKVPYISPILFVKGLVLKRRGIKTRVRSSTIPSSLTSKSFYLYNGRKYLAVMVKPLMRGFKFGEFSHTCTYNAKVKKKSRKGKKKSR